MLYFIIGLLMVFGVAGGVDTASDTDLMWLALVAVVGFVLMIIGADIAKRNRS